MNKMQENLSLLMDGELDKEQKQTTLKQVTEDETLRKTWGRYHLIRDVLSSHNPEYLPLNLDESIHGKMSKK